MSKKRIVVIAVVLGVVVIGGVGAAGLWQYHEQPQFCATCHIMDPYLASWESSDLGAHAHAVEDVTCLDCHEPTVQQQVDELVVYVQGWCGPGSHPPGRSFRTPPLRADGTAPTIYHAVSALRNPQSSRLSRRLHEQRQQPSS